MNTLAMPTDRSAKRLNSAGLVTMGLGVLAMLAPSCTGVSVALLVGALLLAAGLGRMFWASRLEGFGHGLVLFGIGTLTTLGGLALLARPLLSAEALTIALTVYLVVDGLLEIVAALRLRPRASWGLMLVGGILSSVLGLMLWLQVPLADDRAVGIFLGIKLIFIGLIFVACDPRWRPAGREG